MIHDVPSLAQLIKALQQVPYVASKNIYRVASYFLYSDQAKVEHFCKLVLEAKKNVVACPICFVWQERDRKCSFCHAPKRDRTIICAVETWQDLLAVEKTGGYQGVYHVLGGAISPIEGVSPDDLTIAALIRRLQETEIKELILATSQTPEGEATASFIASKLKGKPFTISCLARGVPVGISLESLDRVTVYKALSERRPF